MKGVTERRADSRLARRCETELSSLERASPGRPKHSSTVLRYFIAARAPKEQEGEATTTTTTATLRGYAPEATASIASTARKAQECETHGASRIPSLVSSRMATPRGKTPWW